VGMAGAVTNYSRQPQQIPVDYADVGGIDALAAKRRRDFAGQALQVARLTGFCVLLRREVLDHIGGFDERYGLGFFDDDDLSVRARRAGFQLFVALGVFVHHFGSRTFAALGIDTHKQLQANFEQFKAKWGADEAAAYHLQESVVSSPSSVVKEETEQAPGLRTTDYGLRSEPGGMSGVGAGCSG
ncbi:MAG: hypothetical protein E6K70_22600, partial [Planctomycetota bacterium]